MSKRVVIAGAGFIGVCIAYELIRAGADVTIMEAHQPGAAASSSSMGWINASFIEREDYYRMRLAAIARHKQLESELGGALQTVWAGSLNWEGDQGALAGLAEELSRFGHPVRVVLREELAELEPALADPPQQALLSAGEGHMDASHALQVLLKLACDGGAQLVCGAGVLGVAPAPGGAVAVETSAGPIEADELVIAAGTASAALVKQCGFHLPMQNEPGVLIRTNKVPVDLRHTIWSPDVHIKQLPDGALVCGHQFSGALQEGQEAGEAEMSILSGVKAHLPGAAKDLRIEQTMHGVRPMPADTYPAIGRMGDGAGAPYLAVMHSGITLGPLVGQLVARELISGERDELLEGFSPQRFADDT